MEDTTNIKTLTINVAPCAPWQLSIASEFGRDIDTCETVAEYIRRIRKAMKKTTSITITNWLAQYLPKNIILQLPDEEEWYLLKNGEWETYRFVDGDMDEWMEENPYINQNLKANTTTCCVCIQLNLDTDTVKFEFQAI